MLIFTASHLARWSKPGSICAGDYLEQEVYDQLSKYQELAMAGVDDMQSPVNNADAYLIMQGRLLKWWIISVWIALTTFVCCCSCCLCCCLSKPTDAVSRGVEYKE